MHAHNDTIDIARSDPVDIGWHTFILYTREYAEFCQQIAGRFIHHVPNDGHQADAQRPQSASRTVDAIERAGYAADLELWPAASGNCGPCHEEGNCAASGKDGTEKDKRKEK